MKNLANSTDFSAEEQALFLSFLAEENITPVQVIPRSANTDGTLPLSFAQQRLWFLDQLIPNSSLYNCPVAARLQGRLDLNALKRSLNEIIRRHDALRTTFQAVAEQPVQAITPTSNLRLPLVDLRKLPQAARETETRRLIAAEAGRPFDLAKDSMMRAHLLCLSHEDYVLLLTVHHISSDGWSMGVLVKEMVALYEAYSHGRPSPLEELPLQYVDYAVWQRESMRDEALQTQLAYWKQRLADAPPMLDLPLDHPRPMVQSHRGAVRSLKLSPALLISLTELSQQQGVTLFMTLLAAFQVLLARYTRQDDISVATPVAGRNRAELEGLIGFFVNTLVLRTNLSGNPPFSELLRRVREVALGAYAHQDLPFERLVEELQPARDLGTNPLFQVMMVLQNAPAEIVTLPGLNLSLLPNESLTAKFDLTLFLNQTGDGLGVALEYSTDLFEPETIGRMLAHYEKLLECVTVDPERSVSDLEFITAGEREQLLVEWNATAVSLDQTSVVSLFENQVKRTPYAPAVEFGDQQLTYRELNRRANQLGHYLRKLGVGPEARVGICLERSCEIVIAVLGVLKAGAAYVPLDPSYPKERLAFIVADTQMPVLLTLEHLLPILPELSERVICLDADRGLIERESDGPCVGDLMPDNLAYVIYTSGSTGKPKGVLVSHRNLAHSTAARAFYYQAPVTKFLLLSSFAFDSSIAGIFWTLCEGGTISLPGNNFQQDLGQLTKQIAQQNISHLLTLPSVHALILAEPQPQRLASLRAVIVAGESCPVGLLEQHYELLPDAALFNEYGPTEGTVWSSVCDCRFQNRGSAQVSIGRPIANVQIYILDARLNPAPVGVSGELFIGGAGITRGYLNRPELTAEKFIPNPFGAEGTRLYRTGDLARRLPDGNVEFLGREDQQVKIRGYRIELGEIEAVLLQHQTIRECVVVAREDEAGDKRLVAYLVSHAQPGPTVSDLRAFIKDRLPDYMAPAVFVTLASLPVMSNGKIDRRALPAPETPELASTFVAPVTRLEKLLAEIWIEVLKVPRVGINDNFFTLGGHSLLAIRTVARIRDVFQVELQVRSLFDLPTVAELSPHIEELMRAGAGLEVPALRPRTSNGHLHLSYAQQRLWFLDQLTPHNRAYNLPLGFRVDGPLNLSALQQSLNETVKRHESLRTNFINIDGQPFQIIAPARVQDLPIISLESFPEADRELVVQRLVRAAAQQPFDLASDALFRTTVFRLGEQEHVLLVVMHHIISDGWSMEVLVRDVRRGYRALCQGVPSELPELPIQYADYATWQRQWLNGEVLERQLSYWRNQLDGLSQLNLPTDRPRPSALSLQGNAVAFEVPESLTAKLRELSHSEGSTLFIILLASFQILLARYCGQNDIAVGTPAAGRRWVETEDLVGFFVNTLVMRASLSDDLTIREVLRCVREVTLEAHTHQDVPFEKLVEELQPQRTLSHGPLFQTMFVFLNEGERLAALDGLVFSSLEFNHGTEKNDLTLRIVEQQNKLAGSLSYSTDLFDESTISQMTAHWQRILETIIADPEQLLRDLELLGPDERRQVLTEWNATECQFSADNCLHEVFERQVARTPDAVAVSFAEQRLSYAELNRRANQLAHYLRKAGVGPETTVALYLERSVDMIVALIGVLKAGGAYLPLETTHPRARIQYALEDAGPCVILAQERTAAMLPENHAPVLCIDSDWQRIAAEPEDTPLSHVTAENLAYVIYTSGSTGGARGVMIRRRSVLNLATALREKVYPAGNAPLRVSVNAPLVFDSSVKQLVQLLHGHELCIIPEEVRRDGNELVNYLRRREIEVLDCTPSQLRLLIASGLFDSGSQSLRLVLVGGEAIDEETWQLLASIKSTTFFNVYGPTECTVDATVHRIESSFTEALIGRPLGNVQTYLLDGHHRPVPPGVHAELVIGGAGVARGYLARPGLTAERFVPDRFSGKAGERMYRSGDRVRYRRNGEISFLGRLDHQVKIRGHRIEPGEIEAALQKDPQVREAVVVEREERGGGDKRLVAYIVAAQQARQQASLSLPALQKSLREQLPDYMIPAGWVVLDGVPLTPNGKIDRAALPEPGRMRLDTGQSFVAPPTLIEETMAAIWREVLDLEHVDGADNFFWLGGHSLLATRIISRIRESFQVELPVRSVFESPALAELSKRVETMMRSGTSMAAPALKPLARDNQIPLSYAQQRLWVLDQLLPGSNAYNMPVEIFLDAGLSIDALEQSLTEVLRRHEALRTTFALVGGHPVQQINPPTAWKLPLVDLRGFDAGERGAVVERLRQESALRSFNLETGPLLRARLILVDEEQSLFLLNLHHAVSDGWSMGVLLHEIETLYGAYSQGLPSPLAELEVQYADYAKWQREWLQGDILKEEVTFWRRQLEGAPTLLELETDRPRQSLRPRHGAHHPVVFSAEVSQWLRQFHRQEAATLFMTLMAGFHALLWRYTGQSDILVGTPVAGRSRVELEPMIGFFVNMIPIRTNFSGNPTFRELVHQVRDAALAAYTHQELPFDKLVEELQPRRSPGRNPIFQAILTFNNAAPQMSLAKVRAPAGVPVSADVKFDLEVHLQDTPGGITGSFVYSPELFEPAFISRMVYHFQRLFEIAMIQPDRELSTLSLLDEAEYRQVVEEWNDTAVPLPEACIRQIFEQQVAQRPDAVAIEFEQEQLSYHELNRRADELARRLQREGVKAEVFVGVMLERSVELFVALLGITKAGGVYVPINLTDPPKRVQFILQDAGVQVLVTSKQIAASLGNTGLTQVYVDEISEETAPFPLSSTTPDNLAYLMYTSGSTGTPKGVEITQRNVLRLVKGANYADLNSEEIFMQFAPVSFDASTFEIWGCLLNGARLVVFPPYLPSLAELAQFINTKQVTTLWLTSGLFHQLVEGVVSGLGALKQLLAGGEELSPAHVCKALDQMNDCRLINGYGPTETTTFACCYQVPRDFSAPSVPIGRPISNTTAYVLNAMQPAGVGERGELFIGGEGLGRGYHNRPDLTAERFLPNPYGVRPGDRLYRSGDAARYLNHGVIQFLGRVDDQVKISGFRIEPREIEVVLSSHPALTAAVVVVKEFTPGDKFLVAYVVAQSKPGPDSDELRGYLKERLPEYMAPSVFVALDALPLTPHGKIDRAALPEPELSRNRSGREYVAPQNDLQQQLVDIWEELFKLHPIGVKDNFFELDGHSLQMIMLLARVEEKLGKRVPMADLFAEPTIERLAELIGHGKENLCHSLLVPLQTKGTKPILFCPHASGGNVWCYKELVHYLGDDQPFYGVQPREPENGLAYHTEIEAMASDYVRAIRGFQPSGPYWLAGWSMGGVIAFEMARQLQRQGQEVALLAMIDARVPDTEGTEFNWGVLLSIFAFDLGLNHENLSTTLEETTVRPQMTQLRQVWLDARRAGLVPANMTLIEFRKLFDTFKLHANTMRRYRPGQFAGGITLFSAEQDHEHPPAKQPRPCKGWDQLVTGGVDIHVVPGDHFSMVREPHVRVLAERLRSCIDDTLQRARH